MQKADCIVAGNGLAGTLLAFFLLEKGFSVAMIGESTPGSSSRVAAGIIHPVTGRRLVKSWMADTFIPFAEETYAICESRTGSRFYHQRDIVELIKETREYNEWVSRSNEPDLAGYVSIPPKLPHADSLNAFAYCAQVHGGYLDLNVFLDAMQQYLEKHGLVLNEKFTFDSFVFESDGVRYNDIAAKHVIFCEGYKGMMNPLWKDLPWQPSKGEILLIRCKVLNAKEILNRKIFILPVGDDIYKAGSTYAWDSLNELPTAEAREKLYDELKKILAVPFEVIGHVAGVRPTVKERRPFLGMHPVQKRVGIFNGLGTKGVMTGPWLARHFSEHLKSDSPIMSEVNISRFEETLLQAS